MILTRGPPDEAEMFYVHALGCSPDPARHARGASMHVNVGVSCSFVLCVCLGFQFSHARLHAQARCVNSIRHPRCMRLPLHPRARRSGEA